MVSYFLILLQDIRVICCGHSPASVATPDGHYAQPSSSTYGTATGIPAVAPKESTSAWPPKDPVEQVSRPLEYSDVSNAPSSDPPVTANTAKFEEMPAPRKSAWPPENV